MLTLENIANHIRRTGYPCWWLYVVKNFNRVPIMNYYCDDCDEGDSVAQKCDKAIKHLQDVVSDGYPANTVFNIELKTNPKSNQSAALGPFAFTVKDTTEQEQQQPQQGFNGFGAVPPGFVSEAYLNGKLAEVQAEGKKQLQEALFAMRERELKEKYDRIEEQLQQKEKELKDEEKKYNTGTGQAADALYLAIKKIVAELIPGIKPQPQQTLGDPQPQPAAEEIKDPEKAAAVNKLANLLYEDPRMNLKNIELLTQSINAKLNDHEFYNNQSNAEPADIAGDGSAIDTED